MKKKVIIIFLVFISIVIVYVWQLLGIAESIGTKQEPAIRIKSQLNNEKLYNCLSKNNLFISLIPMKKGFSIDSVIKPEPDFDITGFVPILKDSILLEVRLFDYNYRNVNKIWYLDEEQYYVFDEIYDLTKNEIFNIQYALNKLCWQCR